MTAQPLPPRIANAFTHQAAACRVLGSPFTALLLEMIADKGLPQSRFAERIAAWPGDVTSNGDSVPLRTASAFHQLVLRELDRGLMGLYPPATGWTDDARIADALATAVGAHDDFLYHCLDSPPQTNEIRRCNAIYPALCHIASRTGLPLQLSELGASAGLNLLVEHYSYKFADSVFGHPDSPVKLAPEWKGTLPPLLDVEIVERRGCDLRPFDLLSDDDRIRLQSYIWPDQADRMDRLRAAMEMSKQHDCHVDRSDAAEWVAARLENRQGNCAHVVYHTIAWQYFPDAVKAQATGSIEAAGRRATEKTPLFWLSMEADGKHPGASLRQVRWPRGEANELARVDFHGRWIDWQV